MAIVLFVLAACLYAARQVLLIRANRGVKVPFWWGQPEHTPMASRVLTLLAVASVVLGAMNLDEQFGLWWRLALAGVLIPVAFLLPVAIVRVTDSLGGSARADSQ